MQTPYRGGCSCPAGREERVLCGSVKCQLSSSILHLEKGPSNRTEAFADTDKTN